ncbi:8-hydroxy-dADP phosphatase [Aureococcus anophagefferens]|nr:8-hydroxy-dADP phosphatase [Aureococcus anophagefferens]
MRRVMATLLLLDDQPLPYKGVLYDLRGSSAAYTDVSVDDFAVRLGALERAWRDEAQLSGWVALPLALARFAEAAARRGFELHHAEGDSMVLYKWFGAGEDKVPPYGNTQVGCAGFVVNDKNEILVVKEWQSANDGADRVPSPNWKLPGGLADRGESFFECAARETLEETGVACRAVSVLGMWHRHGVRPWGKSDIYCVVRLEPLGPLAIDADPEEISDCKWYDAAAFAAEERHPLITKVLAEVYGLRRGDAVAGAFEPKCDFANLGVQWPGRDPYATYFPKVSGAKRLPARIRAGNNRWNGPALPGGVFVNGLVVYDDGGAVVHERLLAGDVVADAVGFADGLGLDVAATPRRPPTPRHWRTDELADAYHEPRPRVVDAVADAAAGANKLLLLADADVRASLPPPARGPRRRSLAHDARGPALRGSKREGVRAYLDHFGLDEGADLLAVGDGENDAAPARRAGAAAGNAARRGGRGGRARDADEHAVNARRMGIEIPHPEGIAPEDSWRSTDASGVETATTVYTVVLDGQMYTQTEVQVGTGPVDASKSATTAAPPDEEPAVAAEPA